ncbi:MAG: hypothetical protein ACI8RD_005991 [Bacillariaceae sp.]|jgi:hypothetical protein
MEYGFWYVIFDVTKWHTTKLITTTRHEAKEFDLQKQQTVFVKLHLQSHPGVRTSLDSYTRFV